MAIKKIKKDEEAPEVPEVIETVEEAPEKPTKTTPPPKKATSNLEVLDAGKNGSYEVLVVEEKDEKVVVLVQKTVKRGAAGFVEYAVGTRLTVSPEMIE
jgi:hypothetical protein